MNRQISTLDLYLLLRERIGEQSAQMLVEYLEQRTAQKARAVKADSAKRLDFQESLTDVRLELLSLKEEMLKMMCLLSMGQIVVIIWVVQLFLKK